MENKEGGSTMVSAIISEHSSCGLKMPQQLTTLPHLFTMLANYDNENLMLRIVAEFGTNAEQEVSTTFLQIDRSAISAGLLYPCIVSAFLFLSGCFKGPVTIGLNRIPTT